MSWVFPIAATLMPYEEMLMTFYSPELLKDGMYSNLNII